MAGLDLVAEAGTASIYVTQHEVHYMINLNDIFLSQGWLLSLQHQ